MTEDLIKKINAGLAFILKDADRRYRLGLISDALLRHSKEFVLRKGKRIRPLLFVLSYKGYAGPKASCDKKLFASAASIELLHDYMLIHDDVIDNSDLRRGKPTLHKVFDARLRLSSDVKIGVPLAIVAGDVLFALAIEAFLSIDVAPARKERALRKLVETAAYTGAGEFIDVVFSHKKIQQMSRREIFLTYTLKTAKYTFECPLVMGAILAGAPRSEQAKLARLGLAAGQAFQIYDDFLDLFATEEVIGKPILTDLLESKKTLLVFEAYRRLKGPGKKALLEILNRKEKRPADLEGIRRLIMESGSYDYCLKEMTSLQEKALRICRCLTMKESARETLTSLIARLSPSRMVLNIRK